MLGLRKSVVAGVILLIMLLNGAFVKTSPHGHHRNYQPPGLVIVGTSNTIGFSDTAEILCDNTVSNFHELAKKSESKGYKCQSVEDTLNEIEACLNKVEQERSLVNKADECITLSPINTSTALIIGEGGCIMILIVVIVVYELLLRKLCNCLVTIKGDNENNNNGKDNYPQSSMKMRGSSAEKNESIASISINADQGTNNVSDPSATPVEVGSLQKKEELPNVLKVKGY